MRSRLRALVDGELPRMRLPFALLCGCALLLLGLTAFANDTADWQRRVSAAFLRGGAVPAGAPASRAAFELLFWPVLLAAAGCRLALMVAGPLRFRRAVGRPLATDLLAAAVLAQLVGGALFLLLFGDRAAVRAAEAWIGAHVPTLFVVPAPFAVLAASVVANFAYYWWHRAQHAWRPLWLLTHRAHHAPPQLTVIGTAPTEDPVGGLVSCVPRALVLGAATQLFATAPMLPEAFLWSLVSWTAFEALNHDEGCYRWTQRGRLRRAWFAFLGGGAWHQMHHSARPGHEAVNLSGFPFNVWDRLFGTYVAPEPDPPPFGLTGREHLVRNPLRLAFAGWIQLAGELWCNRGLATRARILFGPARWTPPHAVHVLTRPGVAERA
jgi:sterol desaturase/sphingolipid hydroxylase (fatty acid hydroxylase superfamily)